jgi:hypothetical protein
MLELAKAYHKAVQVLLRIDWETIWIPAAAFDGKLRLWLTESRVRLPLPPIRPAPNLTTHPAGVVPGQVGCGQRQLSLGRLGVDFSSQGILGLGEL